MTKSIQPEQDHAKIENLKKQIDKTDKRIFLIITAFLTSAVLIAVFDLFLDEDTSLNNFLIANYPFLSGIFEVIVLILAVTLIFFVVYLFILFKKHFKLRALLGQKGIDSLAERLRNFFEKWTKDDRNDPDLD